MTSGTCTLVVALCLSSACAAHPPASAPRPAPATEPAEPLPAADSTPIGPAVVVENADAAPRSNGDLLRNPDFHQAMDDVRRLRLVASFQEMRRGLLRVSTGAQFETGTSVAYNFTRLHAAYSRSIDYYGEAIIEIWRNGRKVGEYTREGLLLGPEYSTPRP
jgi:hypothetical protein